MIIEIFDSLGHDSSCFVLRSAVESPDIAGMAWPWSVWIQFGTTNPVSNPPELYEHRRNVMGNDLNTYHQKIASDPTRSQFWPGLSIAAQTSFQMLIGARRWRFEPIRRSGRDLLWSCFTAVAHNCGSSRMLSLKRADSSAFLWQFGFALKFFVL
jgi:hypothetical protein